MTNTERMMASEASPDAESKGQSLRGPGYLHSLKVSPINCFSNKGKNSNYTVEKTARHLLNQS